MGGYQDTAQERAQAHALLAPAQTRYFVYQGLLEGCLEISADRLPEGEREDLEVSDDVWDTVD